MREYRTLSLRLMVICLIAALALAGVNALTAPIIETQKKNTANAGRRELIPDASDFVEAAAMDRFTAKYPEVTDAYTAVDASGNVLGYTMDVETKGFGGTIELNIGVLTDGTIAGMRIVSHSETEGLGANAAKPAFYNQFTNIPDTSSVQVMTGASVTSHAVIKAVDLAQTFAKECGPILQDASAQVSEEPAGEDTGVVSGNTVTETAEGFAGTVTVNVTFNDDGTIASVTADVSTETAGVGQRAGEEDYLGQFVGQSNADGVDTLSGATYSSTAVKEAINKACEKFAAGGASSSAEGTTITESAQGFAGEVTVNVTFNDDGTIASVTADVSTETAGVGQRAGEDDYLGQFVGQSNADGVDTLSGATYSSTAVKEAINKACEQFAGN